MIHKFPKTISEILIHRRLTLHMVHKFIVEVVLKQKALVPFFFILKSFYDHCDERKSFLEMILKDTLGENVSDFTFTDHVAFVFWQVPLLRYECLEEKIQQNLAIF